MNIKNLRKTSAFSLIELMVVIAIVALLAAAAVPSYKSYIAKARLAEVNGFVNAMMQTIASNYSSGVTSGSSTISAPNAFTTSVVGANTSTGGTVTLNMVAGTGIDANFATTAVVVVWTGAETTGAFKWTCTISGGAASPNGTTGGTGLAGIAANQYFLNSAGAVCT